ncbi:MAG: hypothetical protein WD599_06635 [Balneolaceae bacterium]
MIEVEFLNYLDRYLKGKLNEEEKDILWEELLRNPEYLDWLEIEVNAREYYQNHQLTESTDS